MNKLWMGEYYFSDNGTLIKTIAKALYTGNGKDVIIFTMIGENGEVGDPIAMDEDVFTEKFLRKPV